jgi:hypothetical protein
MIMNGEASSGEGIMIILVEDGVYKFASLYGNE